MSEPIPRRPHISAEAMLEAHSRLLHYLLVQLAQEKADPVTYLSAVRIGLTEGMAPSAVVDETRRQVADYMDWILALAEAQLSQKSG